MTLSRLARLMLALLPLGAAGAQAPRPVNIPGLSPAGNAALTRLNTKVDPAVPQQLRDEAALRQEMAALMSAPTVDVDKFAAALKRSEALSARGRAIADAHLIEMLRVLPPADRKVLLRTVTGGRPAGAPGR